MKRILATALSIGLLATAAQAAPRLSSTASTGAYGAHHLASDGALVAEFLQRLFLDRLTEAAPTSDAKREKQKTECEESKRAAEEERKKKTAGAAGPEPIYLAF